MLDRFILTAVSMVDRLVPKDGSVVIRTTPDVSDQGLQFVEAILRRDDAPRVTWLVDDPSGPFVSDLPCRVERARSLRGIVAYWRATVVVHTHGVFGSRPTSRRKLFVNIWHGMPVKRLDPGSDVARFQTDYTVATAPVHAENLAATWDLPLERALVVGLPRNDVLAEPRPETEAGLPRALAERVGRRPLVVWLPTYRTAVRGYMRSEGRELGNVTEFEGADLASVDAMAERLGVHILVKVHPMAEFPGVQEHEHLTVWSTDEMHGRGTTLYPLLSHADLLITDHSSVWIDFLLTRRPIAFAISDLDEYRASRGHYFEDLDELLPGPIASDLRELEPQLAAMLSGEDRWVGARQRALDHHHTHQDARSGDRVAAFVDLAARGAGGASSRRG